MTDRQRGPLRIDLHRRRVQRALRSGLRRQKANNPVYTRAQTRAKSDANPRRVLAGFQREVLAVDFERRLGPVRHDSKRKMQRVFRSFERTFQAIAGALQRITATAFVMRRFDPSGKMRETSLRPSQVRSGHRREHATMESLRRERDWHANDGGRDALFAKDFPERLALPPHLDPGAGQGNAERPES